MPAKTLAVGAPVSSLPLFHPVREPLLVEGERHALPLNIQNKTL
jgi:hypothetical protein